MDPYQRFNLQKRVVANTHQDFNEDEIEVPKLERQQASEMPALKSPQLVPKKSRNMIDLQPTPPLQHHERNASQVKTHRDRRSSVSQIEVTPVKQQQQSPGKKPEELKMLDNEEERQVKQRQQYLYLVKMENMLLAMLGQREKIDFIQSKILENPKNL